MVGLDEAGRGPLAGPVVAGAVCVSSSSYKFIKLKGINDSKKLSEKQRDFFYEKLTNDKNIQWGIGIVSEKVIDKINILEATKLAMQKAINSLCPKLQSFGNQDIVDFLLIDGNFKIDASRLRQSFGVPKQKSIIKGDQKVFSIAAASIIAKVTRDRIVRQMDTRYPQYEFKKHKGYGTVLHLKNIKKFGPCKIHRKSFYPINTFA